MAAAIMQACIQQHLLAAILTRKLNVCVYVPWLLEDPKTSSCKKQILTPSNPTTAHLHVHLCPLVKLAEQAVALQPVLCHLPRQ